MGAYLLAIYYGAMLFGMGALAHWVIARDYRAVNREVGTLTREAP
nr:hypothetical protein [Pseudomonas sp. A46]